MKTNRKSHSNRKAPLITSLALACIFAAGNSGATIPVADVANGAAHWTNSISTYVSKIQEAAEYIKEFQREAERIKNLATQATSLIKGLTSITMSDPQPRSLDHGMEKCDPDFTGFSMADLFQLIAPSLGSSIPEQQRTICKQVVRLQNEKYNENVRLLGVLKSRMNEIKDLSNELKSSDTTGKTGTNIGQGSVVLSQIMADIQYSESIVRVYDNTISSLNDDNKYLAEQALSGKKKGIGESLLATGAQTVALCAGLMVAKSDESDFSCSL